MSYLLTLISLLIIQQGALKVENAWIRNSSTGMNTALFFDVVNSGNEADTLVKVECDAAQIVQMHETFEDGEMMGMREVKSVEIKAKSTFNFKPMANHVMLIKLTQDLKSGENVDVVFYFKKVGKIKLNVPVKKMKMNKM